MSKAKMLDSKEIINITDMHFLIIFFIFYPPITIYFHPTTIAVLRKSSK